MFEEISLCQHKSYQPHYKIPHIWVDASQLLTSTVQVGNIANMHTPLMEWIHIISKLQSLILSLVLIINTSSSKWFFYFLKNHKLNNLSNNL